MRESDISYLQKMDFLLNSLYLHSGCNQNFEMIQESLKEKDIEKGEIQDCLLHLYREGKIYCELLGDRNHSYSDHHNARYLISFKGKVFLDTIGGYESEYIMVQQKLQSDLNYRQRSEDNQIRLNLLTLGLMIGTIGYLLWSMRFFLFRLLHWC